MQKTFDMKKQIKYLSNTKTTKDMNLEIRPFSRKNFGRPVPKMFDVLTKDMRNK